MGIAVNGFGLNLSICHIIVHYGTTCHSLNKLCFVSHLVSTIWWLHWGWVQSAPGSGKSVSVHMNKHSSECHKRSFPWARHWAQTFSILSAASTTGTLQPSIVNKSNIHVLLAHKWCLLSFYFIFNSKGFKRHKHSGAVGIQRHPTQPNKPPQNNMVPAGFTIFRSGYSLEVLLSLDCYEFIKLACNSGLRW